jgi:steroid delta-isomerase-like uncharacterized protein
MSVQQTQQVMDRYWSGEHDSVEAMADDVVFTVMASGETFRGRDAVLAMLDTYYRTAFEARAEPRTSVVGDGHAMIEVTFAGRHVGDFMGIPATGKDVRVPLCVVYDVDDGAITAGRVYFEVPVLLQQLGVSPA